MSALEVFISRTPPAQWEPLVDRCNVKAYQYATNVMRKGSNLISAENEMQRILNGVRAECIYFGRDQSIVEEKEKAFTATLNALKAATPTLDAVCFLRVRANG